MLNIIIRKYIKLDMVKCNIYCRVSSIIRNEYNKDSPTLESQLAKCQKYADTQKIFVNKIYQDIASGRNINRRQLKMLLTDIVESKTSYLLIDDISRLSKNRKDGMEIYNKLKKNDCTIISISDNSHIDTLGEIELFKYKLDKAEEKSNELSKQIKESIRKRRERGEYIGKAPYGYQTTRDIDNKLILIPDEKEQIFIKKIIEMKYQNLSLTKIASTLNKISTKRGKKWSAKSVSYLYTKSIIRIKNFKKINHNYNLRSRVYNN